MKKRFANLNLKITKMKNFFTGKRLKNDSNVFTITCKKEQSKRTKTAAQVGHLLSWLEKKWNKKIWPSDFVFLIKAQFDWELPNFFKVSKVYIIWKINFNCYIKNSKMKNSDFTVWRALYIQTLKYIPWMLMEGERIINCLFRPNV